MPTFLLLLLVTLRFIIRSRVDLQLENLTLCHQIGVLQRSVKKRPKLTSVDRLFWVSLSRLWRGWSSTLVLVKPETVLAWHRRGFRWFWTWKVQQGQPGRPALRTTPARSRMRLELDCDPSPLAFARAHLHFLVNKSHKPLYLIEDGLNL